MSDTPLISPLHPAATEGSLESYYAQGISFETFLPTAEKNAQLWQSVWDRVRLPDDLVERAAALPGAWHLLVLSEDWCGDAVNIVPVLAGLAEAVPTVDLRLLSRDAHLDLMDAHLTNGTSRSIPVVILLDEDFVERGWWGPRPTDLQRWVLEEGLKMDSEERYKIVRRFYARDKGRTTLEEIVDGIEVAAESR
ncbi:MAG: thioredoxin family protein [Rhodothermales bacterium]